MWAKEGNSQEEGQAHFHPLPRPPEGSSPAGGAKGWAWLFGGGLRHPRGTVPSIESSPPTRVKRKGERADGQRKSSSEECAHLDKWVLGQMIPASLPEYAKTGEHVSPQGKTRLKMDRVIVQKTKAS